MLQLEGIQIKNFRNIKNITFGSVFESESNKPLSPLTSIIGRNGVGKSNILDAFSFLSDCLNYDVESACNMKNRGGFQSLRSKNSSEKIFFAVKCREKMNNIIIYYFLILDLDNDKRPYVEMEIMIKSNIDLIDDGNGSINSGNYKSDFIIFVRAGSVGFTGDGVKNINDFEKHKIEINDSRKLALDTIGSLREHTLASTFRNFMKNWYFSYFRPDAARELSISNPQRLLSTSGDNIANFVQFLQNEHKKHFKSVLNRVSQKIPGIKSINAETTIDNRVVLRFSDDSFKDPFLVNQVSDGTLKMFLYLLLLEMPEPPPLMCIEEPENGLYPKLLEGLAHEFRNHANRTEKQSQMFITTHQPYFVDALSPEEVWILERGDDGFAKIRRASDDPIIRDLTAEGLPLGSLWYSNYLD